MGWRLGIFLVSSKQSEYFKRDLSPGSLLCSSLSRNTSLSLFFFFFPKHGHPKFLATRLQEIRTQLRRLGSTRDRGAGSCPSRARPASGRAQELDLPRQRRVSPRRLNMPSQPPRSRPTKRSGRKGSGWALRGAGPFCAGGGFGSGLRWAGSAVV